MSINGKNDLVGSINLFEINAKIPRKVHFDGFIAKFLCWAIFAILVTVVGSTWILYGTLKNMHIRDILRQEGKLVYGEVTKTSVNHDDVYVRYKFYVDGVSYTGQAEIKTGVPTLGHQISILYLPKDPHINQPSNWEWFSLWDVYPYILLFFIVVAAVTMIIVALRERTLARMGVVVEGRVTGCEPNRKLFKIYYEFATEDHVSIEGNSEGQDECDQGTIIPIIYLRNNPKRNSRYPNL
ncbi:MAG: hypothetical protein ABR924_17605 [Terracidiphilus sp.]|jgi:hypothetical protein